MKQTFKKYFSILAIMLAFTTISLAQASEDTENTRETEEATAQSGAVTDSTETEEAEAVVNDVNITSDDIYYSEAEKEEGDNDGYSSNNFGNQTEGIVTKENPITIFPNPMVTSATIRFYNPGNSSVNITIYDNLGRVVLHVPDLLGYELNIDKNVIPEGIYYVKIKKKTSGEDDDDDDNSLLVKDDKQQNDVLIYSAKLVVN